MFFGNERKELLRLKRENAEYEKRCSSLLRAVDTKNNVIRNLHKDLSKAEDKTVRLQKECIRLRREAKEKMREE